MCYVFTMVYLTVGYLGALQYIQCTTTMVCLTIGYLGVLQYIQCATSVVCLTVGGRRPPETSLIHSCVTVRSVPNLSSCMTNNSAACLTRGRSQINTNATNYNSIRKRKITLFTNNGHSLPHYSLLKFMCHCIKSI